jgi:hypothetical protein
MSVAENMPLKRFYSAPKQGVCGVRAHPPLEKYASRRSRHF